MTARLESRHRAAEWLGVLGGGLGVVAGTVAATAGSRIPQWSGDKDAPGALGVLTVVLSLVAALCAARQHRSSLGVGSRAAAALGLLVPGLLCFSTVGRLWSLPGVLLVIAGLLTVDTWKDTMTLLGRNKLRCLLTFLGVCELLMAAGAAPAVLIVGGVGGLALIVAAWLRRTPRAVVISLLALGVLPFTVLAWTAIVPVLLLVGVAAVAVPIVRRTAPALSRP